MDEIFEEIKNTLEDCFDCQVEECTIALSEGIRIDFKNEQDADWFYHTIVQVESEEDLIVDFFDYVKPIEGMDKSLVGYIIRFFLKDPEELIRQLKKQTVREV